MKLAVVEFLKFLGYGMLVMAYFYGAMGLLLLGVWAVTSI